MPTVNNGGRLFLGLGFGSGLAQGSCWSPGRGAGTFDRPSIHQGR